MDTLITLHIADLDKFIPPVINIIRKIKTDNKQFFYTYGNKKKYPYDSMPDSIHKNPTKNKLCSLFTNYIPLLFKMYKADKIILHGLFDIYLMAMLALNPWLLKKCYWFVWGGDLYCHDSDLIKSSRKEIVKDFFRKIIIKRMGYIVTYIKGDYELAQKWYSAKGEYIECYMYMSNVFQIENKVVEEEKNHIAIQVGNSADPSNNHIDILSSLVDFENIKIYIPLSYGDMNYANKVEQYVNNNFKNNVVLMRGFLPYNEYIAFLNRIDIAIFNHARQQAMGNTLMLLSLGKTVYIRNTTTQWDMLKSYGLAIKNVETISLDLLSQQEKNENIKIIKENFTKNKLISQYESFL